MRRSLHNRLSLGLAGLCLAGGAAQAAMPDDARLVAGGAKRFAYRDDDVYPVIATPGRITDIQLEPGESLAGPGALASGDTARWVIGDTASGAGASRRAHVLIKPTRSGLATNLIINSDRRTYHLELRASARTWFSQVSWLYPPPVLVVAAAPPRAVVATPKPEVVSLNFAYRIKGARPRWRPIRVFDDGVRVFIEFAPTVAMGDLPPLFLTGDDGKAVALTNYRIVERRIVVDRLFDRAELRLGLGRGATRVRLLRVEAGS
jgi:type IV secretion system protein VirB9